WRILMQDYDIALKPLLQGSATLTMRELTGTAVAKWLDVDLPKVQNLRLDLRGETVDGGLVHVELQSSNDAAMPLRMAEYCLCVFRLFGRFPRQVELYVRTATPDGERAAWSRRVVRVPPDRYSHAGWRPPAGKCRSWRDCGTIEGRYARLWSGSGGGGAGDCAGAVVDSGWIAALGENGRAGGAENADSHQYSGKRSLGRC